MRTTTGHLRGTRRATQRVSRAISEPLIGAATLEVSGSSSLAVIPASALPPGLYHVVLKADGVRIANTKLIAIR